MFWGFFLLLIEAHLVFNKDRNNFKTREVHQNQDIVPVTVSGHNYQHTSPSHTQQVFDQELDG